MIPTRSGRTPSSSEQTQNTRDDGITEPNQEKENKILLLKHELEKTVEELKFKEKALSELEEELKLALRELKFKDETIRGLEKQISELENMGSSEIHSSGPPSSLPDIGIRLSLETE